MRQAEAEAEANPLALDEQLCKVALIQLHRGQAGLLQTVLPCQRRCCGLCTSCAGLALPASGRACHTPCRP